MKRTELDERLKLPIATVCLAAVAGKDGDLRDAKNHLLDVVAHIIDEERLGARLAVRGQ